MYAYIILLIPLAAWANEEITIELTGGESIEMVRIEAGTFLMGTPTEQILKWKRYNDQQRKLQPTSYKEILYSYEYPQHPVTITTPFYLGKYEVNRGQWFAIVDPEKEIHGPKDSMYNISWLEIQDYIALLNEQTSLSFRLPTEAEWEYAARAGTTTLWWTGDDSKEAEAIIRDTSQPNPWGLVKILGGLWEFTADGKRHYEDKHEIDPLGPDPSDRRSGLLAMIRGGDDGAYGYGSGYGNPFPYYARCAYRMDYYYGTSPYSTGLPTGFRLVLDEDSPTSIKNNESWGRVKKRRRSSILSR